jgi:hypothetical protein
MTGQQGGLHQRAEDYTDAEEMPRAVTPCSYGHGGGGPTLMTRRHNALSSDGA